MSTYSILSMVGLGLKFIHYLFILHAIYVYSIPLEGLCNRTVC